jgi:methylmalonyl-CoA mutase N-terminal domain/subunit
MVVAIEEGFPQREIAESSYRFQQALELKDKVIVGVNDFVPRMSFFFNAHSDFFEEIAKYRAARQVWARVMRDRFGATDERSWKLRFHTQTAGVSLTAQQPYNNVVRTALQALSAVLGGTNSLHTNSLDEALALPTEEAATLALRTQQILAYESGIANVVDPLGGSYFVEALTRQLADETTAYIQQIDAMGGMVVAIEEGFPQREIAESSYRFQQALELKDKVIVGVNDFVQDDAREIDTLYIGEDVSSAQLSRLEATRAKRDNVRVRQALADLARAATTTDNVMPHLMTAVRAYATVGEMCQALRAVWGEYEEVPVI